MPPPDDAPPRPPAEAHPAGSSLVPLASLSSDDRPTIITAPLPTPGNSGVALGETLGNFRVTGTVGVGGMASVLRATDTELGREVALKILPSAMARDADAVARFKAEARSAARLDHDNIARVFACGEDHGRHFIAFEFVAGENLRALIDRRGPLSATESVGLMLQLAAGLAHAASRSVVHRDIKPSNVVVTPDGRAKIVDMGLARNLDAPANGGVTQSGVTLGTFDYISPEQALDPRRADVRSDIYSLGCAFYHALTGRPPVPEGTAARKLAAHANDPVLDPRELNPLVPDDLAAILARMMAKSPANRYQTPEALTAALNTVARRLDPAGESLPVTAGPSRSGAALVAGIAGLAVAVGVLAQPRSADPGPPPFELALPPAAPPTVAGFPPLPVPTPSPIGTVESASQLIAALADPALSEIRLRGAEVYDLATTPIVAPRAKLTLVGPLNGTPPELRVRAGLPLRGCGEIALRGLRFVATGTNTATAEQPNSVTIADADRVEVSGCRFDSTRPSGEATSLRVTRTDGKPTTLTLANSLFGPGRGVGLQLLGGIQATLSQSAFAPRLAGIVLESSPGTTRLVPELTLSSCSFLLDKGAAIEAAGPALIRHEYCVFAAAEPNPADLMRTDPDEQRAAVVRSVQDGPDAARVSSQSDRKSLLYRVDPAATPLRTIGLMGAALSGDAGLAEVPTCPWARPDPTPLLTTPQPWEAFRLSMRLDAARAPYPVRVVGAVELPRAGTRIYDPWPPAAVEAATRIRTVCPDLLAFPELGLGQYRRLADAVAAAGSGEIIEIAHDGPLEIAPVRFNRPGETLTIRAATGRRPVLSGAGTEASPIQVVAGTLTLENLDLAATARPATRSGAAIDASGGDLTLKSCSITLNAADPTRLAAVMVADGAAVVFDDCLIRGTGVGLRIASGDAGQITARGTLFGLSGPVLDARPSAGTPTRIRFERVTAFLTGPLLKLAASETADAALELDLARCLLFTPPAGAVLAARGTSTGRLAALRWQADAQTAFVSDSPLAIWATLTEGAMTESLDAEGFARLTGQRPVQARLELPRGLPSLPAALDPGALVYPVGTPLGVGAELSRVARPGK